MMNPPKNVRDLQHILAVHGDFHTHWEFISIAIFNIFWGSADEHYMSLSAIAKSLHRKKIGKDASVYYQSVEFLRHVFEGFIAAEVTKLLRQRLELPQFTAKSKLTSSAKTKIGDLNDFLVHLTKDFVKSTRKLTNDSGAKQQSKKLFKEIAICLYADNATNIENGYDAIRAQKFFFLRFLGSRAKNYSSETARHLINVLCDYSIRDAFIAINNRTVNHFGTPGKGMALDMCEEHFINSLKKVVKNNPNLSFDHAKNCSLLAVYLQRIYENFSKEIKAAANSSSHSTAEYARDLEAICHYFLVMPEHASFVNAPILEDKALEKIQRNWLKKFKNKKNRISYSSKCHLEDDSQVVYGSDDEDMDDSEDDEDECLGRGENRRLNDDSDEEES
jgi:hypothetical protein